jgi:peptidoglycan/xylan/chitin deacetylase (PgdA/CDA1 family)
MAIRSVILSILSKACWHSGVLCVLRRLASVAQLRQGPSGRAIFPYIARRARPNFQILTYHRLATNHDPFFPALPVDIFARQVSYLSKYYQLVDLSQLLKWMQNGNPIPPNAVVLTFDDGYRDNYDLAFPVLQQYRAPMTLFLTTGFLDRRDVLWNDKVCFALKYTKHRQLIIPWDQKQHYNLETESQRLASMHEILWVLRHISHEDRLRYIEELLTALEIRDFGFLWESMLTWDHVRQMHARGISFGAHTVTHPILSRVSLDQARQEIRQSKQAVETELQTPVELFAFPVGTRVDFSRDLKTVVQEEGFLGAVTTVFGTNTAATDRFELRRTGAPSESTMAIFASKHCWYKFIA